MNYHPGANIFPLMEGQPFDDLVADIEVNGQLEPIILDEATGSILDGRNRYRACIKAGVEPRFDWYTGTDPIGFAVSLNLHRRHLDTSQRSLVFGRIATMRQGERTDLQHSANLPKVSQSQAALLTNVSERSGRDGVKVIRGGSPDLIHAVEVGDVAVSTAAVITALPKDEQSELVARGKTEILAMARELKAKTYITNLTGDFEWYTPHDIINRVREVLGGIDLDPASNEIANEVIRATTYYTKAQNGLNLPWRGRVFLNPPYSRLLIGRFSKKLCEEFDAGGINAAIMLVNNATETAWFQLISSKAAAICFLRHRTSFWGPDKTDTFPMQGQAVLYFDGPKAQGEEHGGIKRFGKIFSEIGNVWYAG